jgi:hypothetical protein
MSDTLKDQLQRWRDNQPQPSKQPTAPKSLGLIKPNLSTHRHTGKHALKSYKGIVEFPHTRGGGIVWLKSAQALTNYQNKNYKVVWL